ncbi:hypothetical protein Sste5346_002344 [Sporothrix stenoceras]|uniref:JmjC domain-containing protein n=1 Tax=Sporothrix stenoceras TaxID=5173 RepID=A0ABR3ZM93_9PEZI
MVTLHRAIWDHCLLAARQIAGADTADANSDANSNSNSKPTIAGLEGCDAPFINLLQRQAAQILRIDADDIPRASPLISRRLDDLIEIAHARFYAYPPSDVPACWRHLYTDASILLFAARWSSFRNRRETLPRASNLRVLRQQTNFNLNLTTADLDLLIRPLDLALILAGGAGPQSRGRAWIHETLDLLHWVLEEDDACLVEEGDTDTHGPRKRPRQHITDPPSLRAPRGQRVHDFASEQQFNDKGSDGGDVFTPPVERPIPVSGPLGFEEFQEYLDRDRGRKRTPLVLKGMLERWPAFDKQGQRLWSSPAYLMHRTLRGRRLVPVEVGRSYVDEGWSQKIVPFEEVLAPLAGWTNGDTAPKGKDEAQPTMYLAQHALFSQIPQLQADLAIPDACYTSTWTEDDGGNNDDDDIGIPEVPVNAWIGPAGTITPLHTDPHHNLLAQVVGRKYIRLYAPEHTAALEPRGYEEGGIDMNNTSKVDVGVVEGWDVVEEADEINDDERNRFRDIPYVDCILEPGDTLYIPLGWWHYVRSLRVSFSVSFWWN